MNRECNRYGLDTVRVTSILKGEDPRARQTLPRRWWEILFPISSLAVMIWLSTLLAKPTVGLNHTWMLLLLAITCCSLFFSGMLLWKRTRFS